MYSQIKSAFVGNLPEDVNEEYLRKLFEQFGEVGAPRWLSHFLQFRLINITCNAEQLCRMCNQVVRVAISRKGQCPVGFVHFANRSVSVYHNSEEYVFVHLICLDIL